jgi:hypothetical protein
MNGETRIMASAPNVVFAPFTVAEIPLRSMISESSGSDRPMPTPFAKTQA